MAGLIHSSSFRSKKVRAKCIITAQTKRSEVCADGVRNIFLQKNFTTWLARLCSQTRLRLSSPARGQAVARSSAQTSLRFVCADGAWSGIFFCRKISRPWLARLRARKHGSAFQVPRALSSYCSLVGSNFTSFRLCRRGDRTSQTLRHTLLKRVCLSNFITRRQ